MKSDPPLYLEKLKELLKCKENIMHLKNGEILNHFACNGLLCAMKEILQYYEVVQSLNDGEALVSSIVNRHFNVSKELLKYENVCISLSNGKALSYAIRSGNVEIVTILLKHMKQIDNVERMLIYITNEIKDDIIDIEDEVNYGNNENLYRCLHLLFTNQQIRHFICTETSVPIQLKSAILSGRNHNT